MTDYLDNDGIWCQVARPRAAEVFRGRAALFLDRDGVIVEEVGYLHRPEDVRLVPGAAAAIAAANRVGVPVVAITNQSGIGRGHYGWPEFQGTQERIAAALADAGAALDMVLARPYHPEGAPPLRHPARRGWFPGSYGRVPGRGARAPAAVPAFARVSGPPRRGVVSPRGRPRCAAPCLIWRPPGANLTPAFRSAKKPSLCPRPAAQENPTPRPASSA